AAGCHDQTLDQRHCASRGFSERRRYRQRGECMKALSIRQPWAWLIVNADRYPDPKLIENRTWSTKIRGQILIHAGQTFDQDGYNYVLASRPDLVGILPAPADLERGGIVGQAE